ncbi:MAG: SRPBCC domain-containing protein [Acidobacteriota bacterium]
MTTLHTTRQLAATPAAVFAAIQDPERLARWWGPNGFTNRFEVFQFQTGGQWVFDMIGPDGKTYPNSSVFAALDTNRQVAIEHVSHPQFRLTITLEPSAGGTLVHWDQAFADASVAESVRHICEPANEQNLDRLTAELRRDPSTRSAP